MQIQVRINEEGALRNQRYAFTDRFTLVSELLQNARRAGATHIEVDYDAAAQLLRVQDDGSGLEDFQKLLSFNETGWDESTRVEERPFGVGFSKCLYAATRCVVASGRQRVDFDTDAALGKALIDVEQVAETEAVAGTCVTLHGVDLPDLAFRVEGLCLGFPVPVLFNGQLLSQRFAERPRSHQHHDEIFDGIDGEGTFILAGQEIALKPGMTICVPANTLARTASAAMHCV